MDNGRWACPYADSHDCRKDFLKSQSAIRHGDSHVNNIQCPVCAQKLARLDTLKQHMRSRHSEAEIKTAEAVGPNNAEAQVDDHSIGLDDDRTGVENDATAANLGNANVRADTVMELVAAEDPNQADLNLVNVEESSGDEAPALQEARAEVPEADESQEHQQQDAPRDQGVVLKAGMLQRSKTKALGKRKREPHLSAEATTTSTSRKKQRRAIEVQPRPPASESRQQSCDDGAESAQEKAAGTGTLRKEATEQPVSRQSSMDAWAQPYHEGSKLRHPLFHPESPETARKKSKFLGVFVPSMNKSNGKPQVSEPAIAQDDEEKDDDDDDDVEHMAAPMPAKKLKMHQNPLRTKDRRSEEGQDLGIAAVVDNEGDDVIRTATSVPAKTSKKRRKTLKVEDEPSSGADDTDSTSSDHAGGGLATSVAKRTFDRSPDVSDEYEPDEGAPEQPSSSVVGNGPDVEQRDELPWPSGKKRPAPRKRVKHQSPADAVEPARERRDSVSKQADTENAPLAELYCRTCNRQFETRMGYRKPSQGSNGTPESVPMRSVFGGILERCRLRQTPQGHRTHNRKTP